MKKKILKAIKAIKAFWYEERANIAGTFIGALLGNIIFDVLVVFFEH